MKKPIVGTPLENPARRIYKRMHSRIFGDPVNDRYDRQTIAIMRRTLNKDSNCVDIGSSVGDILLEMIHVAPNGTHYAFEPIPSSYQRLADSFPNVNVYNLALSDTVGEAPFHHVLSNAGYSGLKSREYPQGNEIVREVKVRTDLLDNIIPENLPVHFIKIDVEGAELQVLKGAVNTIRSNRPITVFEHQLGAADFYGTTPEQVYDLLTNQCNLHVSLMESWLRGRDSLNREEFAEQFYQRINYYFVAHR